MLQAPGEQSGVQCLAQGSHLSRGIEGGESTGHSLHPPTIPARPETRTCDLSVYKSDSLSIRTRLACITKVQNRFQYFTKVGILTVFFFFFYNFMHLADTFIQGDVHIYCQYVCNTVMKLQYLNVNVS